MHETHNPIPARGLRAVLFLIAALSPASAVGADPPFVSASSIHSHLFRPERAIDGDPKTRWASRSFRRKPEWLQVDLGRSVEITEVLIHWENAFSPEYQVQVSDDAKTWRTLVHKRDGKGKAERLTGLSGKGRYLRVLCLKPSRYRIVSIWEIELPDEQGKRILSEARANAIEARRRAVAEGKKLLAALGRKYGFRKIVFAVRSGAPDGHWYANFGYYAEDVKRKCYGRQGRLCLLDTETSKVTALVDDADGAVRDPAVHYDGKTILFSWRKGGADPYHLYEIDADGTGLRRLTDGIYDDIEPTYLPDGGIMFISSRCKRWVNCWLTHVGVLYRCDADGRTIRQISANIEHDNTPWVLHDGRVAYQRWEYIDRNQVTFHHLWTTNPDGTSQMVFFGNMYPGSVFIDAKPIPGSDEILLINSPGHGRREHAGRVAVLTPKCGPDRRSSLRTIGPPDHRDPYPLSADEFLVAYMNELVLMDATGETTLLYTLPEEMDRALFHEPRPLMPRPRERLIPSRVDLTKTTGTLVLADIYRGRNMAGVAPGEIKKLLVLESLPKPINYTGGMEPMSCGGTFTLERILGTVPVEEDGSAHMEVPANRALFFVALDETERSVKRMQSFLTVMPGEVTGCVGCHESRVEPPDNYIALGRLQALDRPPSRITPLKGIPEVMDFPRDIQPILTTHCTKCHNPDDHKGGVILTGDHGPMFSHSYYALTVHQQIADGRNRARANYAPREIGDSASPLMKKLDGSHHDVKVSDEERRMVRYWINSGAAWPGTYAGLGSGMIGGYARNRIDRQDLDWPSVKAAADAIERRCAKCHDKRRPLPRSPSDNMDMPPWAIRYKDPRFRLSRHRLYNLTRPEKSPLLLAPLARSQGGWAMQAKGKDGKAQGKPIEVFQSKSDPDYRKLLASIQDTKKKLDEIKRFDMPGFVPRPQYIREMKRYGVLPDTHDPSAPVDVYALDRAYWESMWCRPAPPAESVGRDRLGRLDRRTR